MARYICNMQSIMQVVGTTRFQLPCPAVDKFAVVLEPITIPFRDATRVQEFYGKAVPIILNRILSRSDTPEGWTDAVASDIESIMDKFTNGQYGRLMSKMMSTMVFGDATYRNAIEYSLLEENDTSYSSVTYLKQCFFKNASAQRDEDIFRAILTTFRLFGWCSYMRLVDFNLVMFVTRMYCTASNFEKNKSKDIVQLCRAVVNQLMGSGTGASLLMRPEYALAHAPVCIGICFLPVISSHMSTYPTCFLRADDNNRLKVCTSLVQDASGGWTWDVTAFGTVITLNSSMGTPHSLVIDASVVNRSMMLYQHQHQQQQQSLQIIPSQPSGVIPCGLIPSHRKRSRSPVRACSAETVPSSQLELFNGVMSAVMQTFSENKDLVARNSSLQLQLQKQQCDLDTQRKKVAILQVLPKDCDITHAVLDILDGGPHPAAATAPAPSSSDPDKHLEEIIAGLDQDMMMMISCGI